LRARFASALGKAVEAVRASPDVLFGSANDADSTNIDATLPDVERVYRLAAIEQLRANQSFWRKVESQEGIRWGAVQRLLAQNAPEFLEDDRERFDWAYIVVKDALGILLGSEGTDYTIQKRADNKMWINVRPRPVSDPVQDDPFESG
jgi:hypothetical protein